MNVSYMARVLREAKLKRMLEKIDRIHEQTGKSKAGLFFDMVGYALRYGAGYNDYIIFEFYNLSRAERKTYLTRMKNKKLVTSLNDPVCARIFDQKNLFDEKFAEYTHREILDIAKIDFPRFQAFLQGKEFFFAKPYVGQSGKGIEKIEVGKFPSPEALWAYVTSPEKHFGVIEEVIVQHPQAEAIYPHSLNCLRVVTLVVGGQAHILYAVFKTGNNGHFVDNMESGGVACHFDLDKGEVTGRGQTSALVCYDAHPETGISFIGYKLPFMDEIKDMVKRAALLVPQMRYVGWDVCLTPDGPALVEGNDYPAYDFPQLPDPDKPRVGLIPKLKALGIQV
ncbi:MAG: carboxylate--amine ligase [Oscillospiraceae bacterium]|nr:carboxylate--amine ligase [Oscillospiraceae bacterium]